MFQPLIVDRSYSVGGAISLLALNGVFFLITKHNLEYPDFYKKLYSLCTPELMHAKYRARFFYLANLFLASSHLPEYLVAAFVKRFSRLCLTAPANSILLVLPFIGNLLLRHKGTFVRIRFQKWVFKGFSSFFCQIFAIFDDFSK